MKKQNYNILLITYPYPVLQARSCTVTSEMTLKGRRPTQTFSKWVPYLIFLTLIWIELLIFTPLWDDFAQWQGRILVDVTWFFWCNISFSRLCVTFRLMYVVSFQAYIFTYFLTSLFTFWVFFFLLEVDLFFTLIWVR